MRPRPHPFAAVSLPVALAALAGWASPSLAQPAAQPEVQWLVYELPPLYITQGPRQGQGVLDRLLREVLIPRLPGLKHLIVALPPKRLEASLQQLPNACVLGMLKNADRETYLHFSRPFPIHATPVLMVRRADAERWRPLLDAQGRVSLKAWLQQPATRFGLAEGRAYGAALDALLDAQPEGRVNKVTSQNPTLNLMQMLQRGRIDGLLVMPFEPQQLHREAGLDLAETNLLPLQEQGPTREGHVACAKSPLGAQVVRQAEEVLTSEAFSQGMKARTGSTPPR
ncbi:TIGR02285 family protein [Roseateles puraquae]|jgi:uncharacterized protein (TIGR02285 family)|uniref:TIGR02285 family protein n=1 Tax=Roseateles puraquae TaxID=431059 RepID=UPI0031DDBBA8